MRHSDGTSDRSACLRLYHGSDVAIEHPDVTLNTGFADLGQGFYLTDDHDAARRRALSRARRTGAATGVVSVFDLDVTGLSWIVAGEHTGGVTSPFCLCFDESTEGLAAWMGYIVSCRKGRTSVAAGEPAIVRAWIATEEVEMVAAGMVAASEMAEYLDVHELIAQYCLRSQEIVDLRLRFIGAEEFARRSG